MDDVHFDWDDANTAHIARHGISRQEVEEAFRNDPVYLDYQFENEGRWVAVGVTNRGRFLVIVWSLREEAVRIVTAFEADKRDESVFLSRRGN